MFDGTQDPSRVGAGYSSEGLSCQRLYSTTCTKRVQGKAHPLDSTPDSQETHAVPL